MLAFFGGNDVWFAVLLVSPAPIAFVAVFTLIRRRLVQPPSELLLRLAAFSGLFSLFLTVGDVVMLPGAVSEMSSDTLCALVPLLMAVLGSSWGVSAASVVLLSRTRRLQIGA